ncbi:MAG: hypothetical protein ACJ8BW_41145, partial [Ktedonobacteraceae bacterium]
MGLRDAAMQPKKRGRPPKKRVLHVQERYQPVVQKIDEQPAQNSSNLAKEAGVLDEFITGPREVQKDIYQRVMELFTTVAEPITRRWQIIQTIFEHALHHFDPGQQGLAITYAQLMPVHADGIHSLYEAVMRGNLPWSFALENSIYLGSTTLAGAAAIHDRMQMWDNLDESERLQYEVDDFERSACACPVTYGGRIAGVLIFSSTQPAFFAHP